MLTFRAIAAGALSEAAVYTAHLLEQTLPDADMALAEYYGRTNGLDAALAEGMGAVPTVRADIDAGVARVLGLSPGATLSEAQLAAILSGRKADGTDIDRKQKKAKRYKASKPGEADRHDTSAIDLCLSAPKSVSVAWAFAKTEAERNSILQAHRDARDATLRYIEQEIGHARMGQGGSKGSEPANLGWISIDHFTARPTIALIRPDPATGVTGTEIYSVGPKLAGDPQLHSHNIVPNVLVTDDGRVVSINRNKMMKRIHEFGALYQAFLAQNLRTIGVAVELCDRTHMAKLPAIPEAACKEFSKRTTDAEGAARSAAAAQGQDWDKMPVEAKVDFLKGGAKSTRRHKTDDLANFKAWFNQAASMGWEHETAITDGPATPADNRHETAFQTALPLLAERLSKNAVVYGPEARLEAARGLIAAGIQDSTDISAVTRKMATEGVLHNGEWTNLIWAETDAGVKITTALQSDQEAELIRLAQDAAADTSRALTEPELDRAQAHLGIDYGGDLGRQQHAAVRAMGQGGDFGVFIGAAGVGKTSRVLPVLVEAYRARGYKVWGVAQAWRQADALTEAGIDRLNTRALQPFLDGIEQGRTKIDADSVVILDELSQIGTRQLLHLLRLRAQHGFQIIATGDDRQCSSIEAGPVIELLRRALGDAAIPEILTTIRQKTEREREIANLFRECTPVATGQAIAMKREDGTAELVEGGYDEAVERIAELAVENDATVSAPTNADALAIGRAMRRRRGLNGGYVIAATDGTGTAYDLALAPSDKVRLFARTHAKFDDTGKVAHIGNNGSVLDVVEANDDGLRLRGASGKTGFIGWEALKPKGEKRVRLAYGECLTIDAAQGITSDRHIFATPAGSGSVSGFKAYVASSRHRVASWMVTSKGAELQAIQNRRPLGVTDPVTDADIWNHVAGNLAKQTLKESATAFLSSVAEGEVKTARAFQAGMRTMEWRDYKGKPRATVRKKRAYGRLKERFGLAVAKVRGLIAGPTAGQLAQ